MAKQRRIRRRGHNVVLAPSFVWVKWCILSLVFLTLVVVCHRYYRDESGESAPVALLGDNSRISLEFGRIPPPPTRIRRSPAPAAPPHPVPLFTQRGYSINQNPTMSSSSSSSSYVPISSQKRVLSPHRPPCNGTVREQQIERCNKLPPADPHHPDVRKWLPTMRDQLVPKINYWGETVETSPDIWTTFMNTVIQPEEKSDEVDVFAQCLVDRYRSEGLDSFFSGAVRDDGCALIIFYFRESSPIETRVLVMSAIANSPDIRTPKTELNQRGAYYSISSPLPEIPPIYIKTVFLVVVSE